MGRDTSTGGGAPSSQPQSMRRTDRRYDISDLRDWTILAVMVALYVLFALTVFLLEPGIR